MQPTESHPAPEPTSAFDAPAVTGRLRRGQVTTLVALGLLFWFMAAMFIQYAVAAGLFGGMSGAVLFALTTPCAWVLVRVSKRAASLRPDQVIIGVAVEAAVAMLCDGVALTWVPSLYGGRTPGLLLGAAWLLWGVGLCFALAVLESSRASAGGRRHAARSERVGPATG